ncbi:MAG: dihydroorotate dehydrogenase electron transfer subunit [Nitrososphaerales archaeon]
MRTNIDKIRIITVEEVIDESPTVRTLIFKDELCAAAKPGQFAMVWIPGIDELPMSVMISEKDGYAGLTIRKHGYASTALYNTIVGSLLGVRGPYGKPFDISKGRVLLVGGGTGLVPLLRLARELVKRKSKKTHVSLIIGARTKEEVIFEKIAKSVLKNVNSKIIVTTEDGSYGFHGLATDAAAKVMERNNLSMVYACGPERMMKKILEMATSYKIPSQASLERIMKCGIGICCSCCVGKYLLCKDGPTMYGETVLGLPEFGSYARDKSGRITNMW